MGLSAGYVRCASTGCWQQGDQLICDVPLCADHRAAMQDHFHVQPTEHAVVYYVGWRNRPDVVKIGTTTNMRKRLRSLTSMLDEAKVLVWEPGSYYLEKKRHREFAHLRIPNESELFRWTPQMHEHVMAVRREVGWRGGARSYCDLTHGGRPTCE